MPNHTGLRSLLRLTPAAALRVTALAAGCIAVGAGCYGGSKNDNSGPGCVTTRTFFEQSVWSAFMGQKCTKCHTPDGIAPAQGAKLILQPSSYPGFIDANLATLTEVSKIDYQGTSELLLKPIGLMNHVGGAQIAKDGPEYVAMTQLVARLGAGDACVEAPNTVIQSIPLMDPGSSLRKAALDLAGRLPTAAEQQSVTTGGDGALDAALDALMKEDAFYDRLKDIFNDVLLTDQFLAYDGFAIDSLDDNDYPHVKPYKDDKSAQYGDRYQVNAAIAREPLDLIAYVVKNQRPFSEILTAGYALVNPFSAAAYGVTGQVKFADPKDPNEWQEAHVTYPSGTAVPHAGVLSTPAFLNRWQTTPTNRNRARARRVYKYFLATDVLKIAERPVDATKVTAMEDPTRNSPSCTVCHKVIDPVAGGFRGYDDHDYAHFDPTTPWHDDMFPPGFDGSDLPATAYTAALPWLTAQLVADPRFVISAIRTVYTGFTGHEPLGYPGDPTAPTFADDLAAWSAQDAFFRATATAFQAGNLDLKIAVKAVIKSPYYRGVAGPPGVNASAALLKDIGTGRLLTPEMLNRKIAAVTGVRWRKGYEWDRQHDWLLEDDKILYGGMDSQKVTSRLAVPNGIMTAVAARMASEVACSVTAFDLSKPQDTRTLFPMVAITEVPESAGHTVDGSVSDIRKNIQYLHGLLLGEKRALTDPEIDRTYQVFLDTWHELAQAGKPDLPWECGAHNDPTTGNPLPMAQQISQDDNHTILAWMAVVDYLLSDYGFLYE